MKKFCFTPYPDSILPEGFLFPKQYRDMSKGVGLPEELAWWFISADSEGGQASWELRSEYGENWIPFAREGDWAAYFDGNDISGDPCVFVIDLGDEDHVLRLENFAEWYAIALEDTKEYLE